MDGGIVLYHYAAGQWHESIGYDTWDHALTITPTGIPWVLNDGWLYRLSTTAAISISRVPTWGKLAVDEQGTVWLSGQAEEGALWQLKP